MEIKEQANQSNGDKEKNKRDATEVAEILGDKNVLKFVLDTNVILAYLSNNNPFHFEARTVIEGLKTKKIWFVMSYLVLGEFIANRDIIDKKLSVKKALDVFLKFDKGLDKRLIGGAPLNVNNIIDVYKKHTKHNKLTKAGFADFIILAEGCEIENSRILTCDKDMYSRGKSIFRDRIYYLPNQTKNIKSDYPRLMNEIQNNFK